ncbi:hypothetical protein A4R26_19265 [Niastella populi]|uniref:Uncharacterized protein n=1 Tax=Niastella populi TaxID=550983 RepID=A0A1V9FR39_9BACT|nr:hypothetical protein A4R26_19265 [Niastella populi]
MQGVKLVRDKFTEMLSSRATQGPAAADNLKFHNFKRSFFQLRCHQAFPAGAVFLFTGCKGNDG